MEVKYYLSHGKSKTSSVDAVVFFDGKRYKMPAGISVDTKFWNSSKMRAKGGGGDDHIFINSRLDNLRDVILEAVKYFSANLQSPSTRDFRIEVENRLAEIRGGEISKQSLLDFARQLQKTAAKSERTLIRYGTTINQLIKYEKKHGVIHFTDVDMVFYNHLKRWLEKNEYSLNTIGGVFKNIKVFMSEAQEAGLHNNSAYRSKKFKVIDENSDSIFLSEDELTRLNELVIDEETVLKLSDKIKKVKGNIERRIESLNDCRDRFLIGACSALRFSDYNILTGLKHDDEYITNRNKKTGSRITIPMHRIIREILKRRNNELPPPVSNQKMNDALKLLGELAGFDEVVERSRTVGGKLITEHFKKYELMSTHAARRSACTNMYLNDIPTRVIMSFSGHKSEKSFLKYIRVKQFEDAIRMKDHPFFN